MKKRVTIFMLSLLLAFGITSAITSSAASAAGYVSKDYLRVVSYDRSMFYKAKVVLQDEKNGYLNVREEPSTSSKSIGKLRHGSIVTVYYEPNMYYSDDWAKIIY